MAVRGVRPLLKQDDFFPDRRARVAVHREVRQASLGQHRHEFFEIVVILSGAGVHVTGDFRHRIEARDVFIIHTRRAHGYERTVDLNLINILIRDDFMARLGRELGGLAGYHALFRLESTRRRQGYASRLRLTEEEMRPVEEWANRLEEETRQSGQGGSLLAEACLTLIVGMLCRRYGRKTGQVARSEVEFGRVLSWIDRELHRPLKVADLAREAKMSERTFHRRFRAAVGTTPTLYLMRSRVRRAADRLGGTNGEKRRISDVAMACGFEDSNYFSRCFRQVMKQSPRAYRKACAVCRPAL